MQFPVAIRCQSPEVKVSDESLAVEAEDELLGEAVLMENLDMMQGGC